MIDATQPARKQLDLGALRERLEGQDGRRLWRSLDELARTPAFQEMVEREFPEQVSAWKDDVSRRRFLQLMSASLAFGGLTACTRQPLERIVPYVKQPEELVPGRPLYFATSRLLGGYAAGLLAESHMGRPTKLEGSPEHPASLGATDVFAQAEILDLYDPDRMQTVTRNGRISTWAEFAAEMARAVSALAAGGGLPLRILTGTVTSPSLAALIRTVLEENPKARWHQWEPAGLHAAREGSLLAFGERLAVRHDFSRADVVLALDADFLTQGPGAVRYARDFMDRRRTRRGATRMNRLYSVESSPSPSGTVADHRMPLSSAEIGHFALAVAAELGLAVGSPPPAGPWRALARTVAGDLASHRGRSIVVAGDQTSPDLHALALAMNRTLGNLGGPVVVAEPVEAEPVDQVASITDLVTALDDGEVDTLLVLGGNPVYDAPADLDFATALGKAARRIYLGQRVNETAELCHWNLPEAHFLESWGDGRAYDGTASMIQPLIEPLYGGKSAWETVAVFTAAGPRDGEEILRSHWQPRLAGADAEKSWRRVLHDGIVPESGSGPREAPATDLAPIAAALLARAAPTPEAPELLLRPDPTVWDGRFANSGWLQECPKPLTKLTWDNALLVSPGLAHRMGLANGQLVAVAAGERSLEVPVWIQPGQAESSATLHLGYGRRKAGRVGSGTGFDAYRLRTSRQLWTVEAVRLGAGTGVHTLASTQLHHNISAQPWQGENLEGRAAEARHLVRVGTFDELREDSSFAHHGGHGPDESLSLYPGWTYEGHAWGLSVDLTACTGCNACVVACQSENNIPVVGKEQVANGREMHWIRIDRYYQGSLADPAVHHQPVMCMHCEQAPCEVVCPVAATVHSDEGLNDMVYNRCVGTRYCSNNCPYKVRRFNFLKYNDTETPVLELLRNPDVTVRVRGVMEKCTYCVQRINGARIGARREGRKIRDGEIVTACQQACPTRAISFGDLNDPSSEVARRKAEPHDYGLLTELGTRPRTTYLAKIVNPHGALGNSSGSGPGSTEGRA